MRILVATWHRQVVGGTERYLACVIPALRAEGHEVACLVERDAEPGADVIDTPDPLACVHRDGTAAAIRRAQGFAPDVCWVHGLEDPDLERALLGAGPCVLFAHGYYGTCGTGTKRFAFPAVAACDRTLGPSCLALTYARRCGGLDPVKVVQTYRRQIMRESVRAQYRRIVVASRHMRDEFVRHGSGKEATIVVPMPLTDVAPVSDRPSHREPGGPIVFLGRLSPEKGPRHLVEAAAIAAVRGVRRGLRFIGDGPERSALQDLARARGVEAGFLGWRGADRVAVLTDACLHAMPSLWPEPFGLAGIEAGALGIPTVAYASGGIPEWLVPGECGELAPVPPRPAALADAIVRALRDPGHYDALCAGAWTKARMRTMRSHLAALLPVLESAHG